MATHRVLGISLGTRKIGLAILERHALCTYGVKSFQGPWSPQKQEEIIRMIEKYLSDYRIRHLAVKIAPRYAGTQALADLLGGIETLSSKKNIALSTCLLSDIKQRWALPNRSNKRMLMKCITERYGELFEECTKALHSKVKHYEKLFEAVGAADLVLRDI